jgi:hypothetical protein
VTKPRRDPAELAAMIEASVSRGLDLVDSFLTVTGKRTRATSRALEIEHRKAVAANQRAVARHRGRTASLRSEVTGGAAMAGVGGALALIDVVAEVGGSSGVPLPAWAWFVAAGSGLYISLRARRKLHTLGPPPAALALVAPPPAMPRGATGSLEVARFTSVRVQIMNMAPSLERLYPGSGDELRRADNEAAGPLTALAERLLVLDQLQRELPGTSAAAAAATSAELVRGRLAEGCSTYDELLSAAARLLAAPDMTRSTAEILGPAVAAMLAYAHGLQRANDL